MECGVQPGWLPRRHRIRGQDGARVGRQHGRPARHAVGACGPVLSAAFSPDGSRVVTASLDHTARVWNAETGAEVATLSGHGDWVWTAAFSPDGSRVVTASEDRTARVWDAKTGAVLATLLGHTGAVFQGGV